MKYFVAHTPAHTKIDAVGQWTIWEGKWCKALHVANDAAILSGIDAPVLLKFLDRYHKILRPHNLKVAPIKGMYADENAFIIAKKAAESHDDALLVLDEHWMDFITANVNEKDIVVVDSLITDKNPYSKVAVPYQAAQTKIDITRIKQRVPYGAKSGIELVLDSLVSNVIKNSTEHDDKFINNELLSTAVYHVTRNTNLLGKSNLITSQRTDDQMIQDLAEAASILICEIDRLIRQKDAVKFANTKFPLLAPVLEATPAYSARMNKNPDNTAIIQDEFLEEIIRRTKPNAKDVVTRKLSEFSYVVELVIRHINQHNVYTLVHTNSMETANKYLPELKEKIKKYELDQPV